MDVSRAVWWVFKHREYYPSRRYLRYWRRLNHLGWWDDEDLDQWATKYENRDLENMFNKYHGRPILEFLELDREMLSKRIDLKSAVISCPFVGALE